MDFVTNSPEILTITRKLTPDEVFVLGSLLTSKTEIVNLSLREELLPDTGAQLGSAISDSSISALALENVNVSTMKSASELISALAASANPALKQLSVSNHATLESAIGYRHMGIFSVFRLLMGEDDIRATRRFFARICQLRTLVSLEIRRIGCFNFDTEAFVAALKTLPLLTDLTIHEAFFRVARPFGDLVALGNIRKLDLNTNTIDDSGVSAMVNAILSSEKHRSSRCELQTLKLGANRLGPEGAKKVIELAKRSPRLRTLDLSLNLICNIFGELGTPLLSLEEIDVSLCMLPGSDFEYIARILPVLSVLRIGMNTIGDAGAQTIAQFILSSGRRTLTELSMGRCAVTEVGALALSTALAKAYRLHTINMSRNQINPKGAITILDALATASTVPLDKICLGGCDIGDSGASAAGRLTERRGCKHVILKGNLIQFRGTKAIADSVMNSACVVQDLDLSENPLGDGGVKYLLDKTVLIPLPLRKQPPPPQSRGVRELNIVKTGMGVGGAMAVKQVVEGHGAIRQLYVSKSTGNRKADGIINDVALWERGLKSAAAGAAILTLL